MLWLVQIEVQTHALLSIEIDLPSTECVCI